MVSCFDIDVFEKHETSLRKHRRGAGIYLTKQPSDLHIVGPRLRIDPHLHVIAMLRDPRDTIVSKHGLDQSAYWAPLAMWKTRIDIMRRLTKHKRFLIVRYEELVREPDKVQERLMTAMPFLKKRETFSTFHTIATPSGAALKALGSLRAITPGSVGNWRSHLPRVKGQLAIHGPISDDLIEFGYERDETWLALLADIEPDLRSSHWPEHRPSRAWKFRRLKYAEAAQ
jgi:hypothetical protein